MNDLEAILAKLDELDRVASTELLRGRCAHCQRDLRALTVALNYSILKHQHLLADERVYNGIRERLCREGEK